LLQVVPNTTKGLERYALKAIAAKAIRDEEENTIVAKKKKDEAAIALAKASISKSEQVAA